jgi:hypothetical protein
MPPSKKQRSRGAASEHDVLLASRGGARRVWRNGAVPVVGPVTAWRLFVVREEVKTLRAPSERRAPARLDL